MASFNIVCGGPGPHNPASGILGTCDRPPTADVRCSSPACAKPDDPTVTNQQTLQQQALTAMVNNRAFVAATKPSTAAAQASAAYDEAVALARQMNGVIRLLLGQLDATN